MRVQAPPQGHCLRCGQPLDGEPYWIRSFPDGEHERCIDWSSRPFPFSKDLEWLRRQHRRLRWLVREVEALGRWLAAQEKHWPVEDALPVVREANQRLQEMRTRLKAAEQNQRRR